VRSVTSEDCRDDLASQVRRNVFETCILGAYRTLVVPGGARQKRDSSIAHLGGRGHISASIPSNVPNFIAVLADATAGRAAYR
jgi:hypothetical protein